GMTYREVANRLKEMESDDFDYDRYIFTGFSVLSKSEQSIFKSMQRMGIADFYWDYASPAMYIKGNRASRFISGYVKEFPSRYNVGLDKMPVFPDINVIAVPSTFGQAKVIAPILKRLYPELFAAGQTDCYNPCNNAEATDNTDPALEQTAVVLPDENLVSPLLNSIPREISTVNVTMGFQLSHTSVATLIKNIVSMQLRARELRSLDTFFFEDVISILSHPMIRARYAALCDSIVATVNKQRMFNIPVTFFDSEEYAPIRPVFSIVKNLNDSDGVIDYLDNLFNWLTEVISPTVTEIHLSDIEASEEAPDSEAFITGSPRLELQYIKAYRAALDELRRLNETYLKSGKIFLEDKTVFHLAERLLGNQSVAYEGMPLKGLQIMGVLESRGLDFDNIILTSMNERIFPRKHYARTFIPEALRRGYGMATLEHQESMYAYYFYRLIARAKNVYLLYDARTSGLRAGDMSRYISQIKYQFPQDKVKFSGSQYRLAPLRPDRMEVAKTDAIMKELERFKSSDNPRYLSAHSLNTYINCPLQFYLANIERYYPENEVYDYMDQGTYGTIVHEVAEKMYLDLKGETESLSLTPETYTSLTDRARIEEYVARSIRRHYLCIDENDPRPLEGDAAIFHKLMVRTIMKMFERESEFEGVEFIAGEESQYVDLKVNEHHTINLNYRIDRIDRLKSPSGEKVIRLVDYKTGSDPTTTPGLDRLFIHGNSVSQPKAMFQLLLYCNAYAAHENYDGPIQPYIYTLRKVAVKPFEPLKVAKKPLDDYRTVNDEFLSRLGELLDELYDKEKPFEAYPSDDNCKYCKFKELCSL
ncbi:MAG: PD-(D/E)XK nuclease family protein, partial [Muribaculaceae bacterium]|nr:PD-(D/E)XK nuclease family protein [Muribaculaceae bacterium]